MKKILLIALVIQSFFIDCYSQSNQVFVSTDRNLKLMLKACEYSADGKYKQAVLCYKQCAIKSDPYCQCFLAYHYEKGLGVAQDYSKAAKWYQKSSEQGNSIAQCTLGRLYENGLGVPKDYFKAATYYIMASEQGDTAAKSSLDRLSNGVMSADDMYQIGCNYYNNKEYSSAMEWFDKAVKNNLITKNRLGACQYYKAKMYEEGGYGVERNLDEAHSLYVVANLNGYANLQSDIQRLQPYVDSIRAVQKAHQDKITVDSIANILSKTNNAKELVKIGAFCEDRQFYKQAFSAVLKAAQMNNTTAMITLGNYYRNGIGTDINPADAFVWYKKAGNLGNSDAQVLTGDCYFDGIGTTQNYKNAVVWYQQAANKGNMYAQFKLGECYENGCGVQNNKKTATNWYMKSADQGYSAAIAALDMLRNNSSMTVEDMFQRGLALYELEEYSEAVQWFEKAAIRGHSASQYQLGRCFYKGIGVTQNYQTAVSWWQKSADQGYDKAQYGLGVCYDFGDGVPQNYQKAVEWYQKAVAQDNTDAQYNLGACYYEGEGVAKDYQKAAELYRQAADKGLVDAQYQLGFLYENGIGLTTDKLKAVEWYKKAANQGDSLAMESLKRLSNGYMTASEMFDIGYEYANNGQYAEAVEWYKKSADLGNAAAQNNLGTCYFNGHGVTKNYYSAFYYIEQAAEQGHSAAQYNLGICYEFGDGVKQNFKKAIKWYDKAAAQGYKGARENSQRAYAKWNQRQQEQAAKLAALNESLSQLSESISKITGKDNETSEDSYENNNNGSSLSSNSNSSSAGNDRFKQHQEHMKEVQKDLRHSISVNNCPSCWGNGKCKHCGGTGKCKDCYDVVTIDGRKYGVSGRWLTQKHEGVKNCLCPVCDGKMKCSYCKGTGNCPNPIHNK
ncbi:MAG: SEL1-like repeat protein [Bacteroidales bacterium]|nr:SEL1-like repeat protein [Bacteroidales bacterium]